MHTAMIRVPLTRFGPKGMLPEDLHARATRGPGRFMLVNVWRNISSTPVATWPLACCDAATVSTDELVVFELHYADRVGENYFARHRPAHRWYYFPRMRRDEVILIKQWDSHGGLASEEDPRAEPWDGPSRGAAAAAKQPEGQSTFALHCAFADPTSLPDAPDRESIEVRCFAIL